MRRGLRPISKKPSEKFWKFHVVKVGQPPTERTLVFKAIMFFKGIPLKVPCIPSNNTRSPPPDCRTQSTVPGLPFFSENRTCLAQCPDLHCVAACFTRCVQDIPMLSALRPKTTKKENHYERVTFVLDSILHVVFVLSFRFGCLGSGAAGPANILDPPQWN